MEVRPRPYTRFQRKLDEIIRDFLPFVENFFDPFIKAASQEGNFEWSAVDQFYNEYQDRLMISYSLEIFCEFVLKLFLRFSCEKERLMIRITYMYEQVKTKAHGDFEAMYCPDCELSKCRKKFHLDARPLLREVNERPGRIYKNFKFTNNSFYSYFRMFPTFYPEDHVYYDYLRYLIKYGLLYIPSSKEAVTARFEDLRCNFYDMRDLEFEFEQDEILLNQLLHTMEKPNFRRLFLIIEATANYVVTSKKHEHARCFNMCSLTVSEPAISQKEVQEFLHFSFADDEVFKTNAFSNFQEVFSDSPKLPSPRTLKHLCRCKIRDCLPRSPTMSSVLYEIKLLPNYLKDYLLFLSD